MKTLSHLTPVLIAPLFLLISSCDSGPQTQENGGPTLKGDWNKDTPAAKTEGTAPKLKSDLKFDTPEGAQPAPKSTGSAPKLKTDWKNEKTDQSATKKVNGFDRLVGCRLVDHRNNDGDSFHLRHDGKTHEIRLYYVDTAEKYYSDRHESQRARVREQGKDFGGLSVDQVIEVGNEGKKFTLELLEGKTFTVFSKWEEVYDSGRYYAFVEVPGGKGRYLSEYLVASGLVRLKTKGVETPDGRNYYAYRDYLRGVESKAKSAGMGAWGK